MAVNIFKDELQHAELFGKPVLTTDWPIPRETVPDGWYCYDMRGTDSDPAAHAVLVDYTSYDHSGTVLSPKPLKRPATKARRIGKEVFGKAFADGCAAMQYLREQAQELWLDPERIAAVGFSAGGNLASALGVLAASAQRPDALVLGYGSFRPSCQQTGGFEQPDLIDRIDQNTPPAFLFNTQADSVVPAKDTLLFALALAQAGVPFESHTFLTGDHGLSLATACTTDDGSSDPDVAQWHPIGGEPQDFHPNQNQAGANRAGGAFPWRECPVRL